MDSSIPNEPPILVKGSTLSSKHYIKYVALLLAGISATHYFENLEVRLLTPLRNLYYFGSITDESINSDGVLERRYKSQDKAQINPVTLTNQVNSITNSILQNSKDRKDISSITDQDLNKLLGVANYLMNYGTKHLYKGMGYVLLPYDFDYDSYDERLEAPWYSGMAQGNAIKTFLASYIATGNKDYLTFAQLLGNALRVPISETGVTIILSEKCYWFEEYAQAGILPPKVLNGHNFALIGLKELASFDSSYSDLYEKGLNGLKQELPKYNIFVWSRYDQIKYLANPKYHSIHINQLKELNQNGTDEILKKYETIFSIQRIIPLGIYYRLIFYPHRSLVFITMINISVLICIERIYAFIKRRRVK